MATATDDPCVVLGLKEANSQKQVESAFRRRALACHPDRNPKDPLAKKKFLRLSRAKEVLLSRLASRIGPSKAASRQAKPEDDAHSRGRKAAEKARKARQVREQNRRCAQAEKLRQREAADAKERRRSEVEEAQAKSRRDAMRAEEERLERAAALDRQRAAVLEAYWQKKTANAMRQQRAPQDSTHSNPDPQVLKAPRSLIERFAASTERTLRVAGPLSAERRSQILLAASSFGYKIVEDSECLVICKQQDVEDVSSDNDSPWDAPVEVSGKRRRRKGKLWSQSSDQAASKARDYVDKHQRALERLASRHHAGDRRGILRTDPVVLPGRSWWVHDEEADRYAKFVDRCGF